MEFGDGGGVFQGGEGIGHGLGDVDVIPGLV
jgi:hypothetical protein